MSIVASTAIGPEQSPAAEAAVVPYSGETYYGLPPVKRSIYRWTIGTGYFSIGLAGASQMLSTVLDYSGIPDREPMVRAGRYAALAGSLITPALYTKELGTPRRWYNMLRIYRSTSLMSVGGAWLLTGFGITSGAAVAGQVLAESGYPKAGDIMARVFSIPAALAGSFLSMYMGTEMEETSTPLWAETSPLLPVLFGAANAANACAVFELAGDRAHVDDESLKPVMMLALLTEAAAVYQLRQVELTWTESARRSGRYRSRYDLLYRTGLITLGKAAGLLMRAAAVWGGKRWRSLRPLASLATLATGYALPAVMLIQGNRSADRARDYFEFASPSVASSGKRRETSDKTEGPPKSLSIAKWTAIAGLAVAAAAIVMKPKKAY